MIRLIRARPPKGPSEQPKRQPMAQADLALFRRRTTARMATRHIATTDKAIDNIAKSIGADSFAVTVTVAGAVAVEVEAVVTCEVILVVIVVATLTLRE